jgi:hypothetical protein
MQVQEVLRVPLPITIMLQVATGARQLTVPSILPVVPVDMVAGLLPMLYYGVGWEVAICGGKAVRWFFPVTRILLAVMQQVLEGAVAEPQHPVRGEMELMERSLSMNTNNITGYSLSVF